LAAATGCGSPENKPATLSRDALSTGFVALVGPLPGAGAMTLTEVRKNLASRLRCPRTSLTAYVLPEEQSHDEVPGAVRQVVLSASLQCPDGAAAQSAIRDVTENYLVAPNWHAVSGPPLGEDSLYAVSTAGISIGPGADASAAVWRDNNDVEIVVLAGPSGSTIPLVEALAQSQQRGA
jgi:hypothetical protein